ncbi:MAG: transglycosylase domain-containing protein [Bryobacterales bacterium]|nr:transglycosylase domain-containing protein [Bryobacterales bacterium]
MPPYPSLSSKQLRLLACALIFLVAVFIGAGFAYTRATRVIDDAMDYKFRRIALHSWQAPGAASVKYFAGSLDKHRFRVQAVTLAETSPWVKKAVVAIEDHRFFDHSGIDFKRTARAVWDSFANSNRPRGTSSLTQQLARSLYLSTERSYRRKVREALIAMELERRKSKDEILELYLNTVPMGHRASYDLMGLGAASLDLFGKPLNNLDLPQSALLAGLIQQPTSLHPRRRPDAAKERRNLVLAVMRKLGYIDDNQYHSAVAAPLGVLPEQATHNAYSSGQYFIDAVRRELRDLEQPEKPVDVVTTIDPRLQRIAEKTVALYGPKLDKLTAARHKGEKPEIALVALDTHSGAIRALVGGRNFEASQLNHAFSQRQPGSTFKPIVYAAALERSVRYGDFAFTPFTPVDDTPAVFIFNNVAYEPANYGGVVRGLMPARQALALSSNVATVRVALKVGYERVAALAQKVGLRSTQATPSAALGAYEVTPVQLAGAYTPFANRGLALKPYTIESIADRMTGALLYQHNTPAIPALDPTSAYLTTNMLEDVLTWGTGAYARQMGFRLPAAGKTGTDDDGWFAGFTTELLCVVWVGFDDNRDLGLDGSKSALPVWTDFMKEAGNLAPYNKAAKFEKPAAVDRFLAAMAPPPPPPDPELPALSTPRIAADLPLN